MDNCAVMEMMDNDAVAVMMKLSFSRVSKTLARSVKLKFYARNREVAFSQSTVRHFLHRKTGDTRQCW